MGNFRLVMPSCQSTETVYRQALYKMFSGLVKMMLLVYIGGGRVVKCVYVLGLNCLHCEEGE